MSSSYVVRYTSRLVSQHQHRHHKSTTIIRAFQLFEDRLVRKWITVTKDDVAVLHDQKTVMDIR